MQFTDFFIELGQPAIYYPKMAEITNGDIVAVQFLSQLLYWTRVKAGEKQGWIWKTSDELERETGLTYAKQKRVRKVLIDLGLIEENYRRSTHEIHFRVNLDVLNQLWMERFHQEAIQPKAKTKKKFTVEDLKVEESNTKKPEKKSFTDYLLLSANTPEAKQARRLQEMQKFVEEKLDLIADGGSWISFFEWAYNREQKHKQSLETFVYWMLDNPAYNPAYWGTSKMKTMWAQAFTKEAERSRNTDPFKIEFPEIEDEEVAPMPEWLEKEYYKKDNNNEKKV